MQCHVSGEVDVDDTEFSAFVRAHTSVLLKSAFLMTKNAAAAEDLVQDTFVRLHPKWSCVAGATVPLAYVRRSMLNNFLNSSRSRSSQERPVAQVRDRSDESDLADQVTDRLLVAGLLDSLPPRQRAVLVLRFFHDLGDDEIAAEVGCRQATARSILSRGLAALRAETERRPPATAQTKGTPS